MGKIRKYQQYNYIPGDLFIFPEGIEGIVLKVDEFHDAIKVKLIDIDSNPGREVEKMLSARGWFLEGEHWVCEAYTIITQN